MYEYDPEKDFFSIPRNGFGHLLVWFVARKIGSSTCDVLPQQGCYVKTWAKFEDEVSSDQLIPSSSFQRARGFGTPISRLKASVMESKVLYSLLRPLAKALGLTHQKDPVIATYDYQ